jgi:hypothetical protein
MFVGVFLESEVMEGQDMESRDSFVAVDSNSKIRNLGKLLNGEVVSNRPRPIPHKVVDHRKRIRIANKVVDEVIQGFLVSR